MPSDDHVSLSGEVNVLVTWKEGEGVIKRERGYLLLHRFEFRGDESTADWVNPTGLSHPILGFTEHNRAEDQKGCECSHMLLANSPSLMIRKRGLGKIGLI